MIRSANQSYAGKLSAIDGKCGHVKDFYFDDLQWVVRYVVVDTGFWLSGHLVLLSPCAVENFFQDGDSIRVNLNRQKIEASPPIEAHQPVTRQFEEKYHDYYDWPSYWEAGGMWGAAGLDMPAPPRVHPSHQQPRENPARHGDDPHLRSTKALTGYQIHMDEEEIGHVSDFMIDDENWAICHLVVQTGHWFSRKEIVISPRNIARISDEDSAVYVNITKDAILNAREYLLPHALALGSHSL
jgi:uncharacterized protein YrrD